MCDITQTSSVCTQVPLPLVIFECLSDLVGKIVCDSDLSLPIHRLVRREWGRKVHSVLSSPPFFLKELKENEYEVRSIATIHVLCC